MKNTKLTIVAMLVAAIFMITACSSLNGKEEDISLNKAEWNTNYTYVFVHGLSGWGHYDFQNKFIPYWGMKNGSLMKQLKKQGFKAYDASVAPQGSAWDRACELYAQLTGTRTDYGKEHSERCGHERYGRDFSKAPLIPKWDSENKINLIGHSFGGVTERLLAHLMANGSEAERAVTDADDLSPLFAGGHADWIYSVTALAAPHNGTTAYHVPEENTEAKSGMQRAMEKSYAPKKDGRADYDYADFDMHIQNAAEINKWLKTLDNAYYFSFPCSATQTAKDGSQEPVKEIMEGMFQPSSKRMGSFEGLTPDGLMLGKEWQENDGLVNTISAMAPDYAPQKSYTDALALEKGVWYIMPTYAGDHMSLQGGFSIKNNITDFYTKHLCSINQL
jgi:triacylglycerol esterase/lipase EstA (alpha/beta hydrolase family)